jgi:hypothetical protein
MKRKLLRAVPALHWGAGKDTTLCGALEASLRAAGNDRDHLYEWLMGCSGAAFRFEIDEVRWDPAVTAAHGRETLQRAARAAALTVDQVDPPFDDEMRELIWERIVESIDGSLAPLARGVLGPEFGVLCGYDGEARTLFARTYFDQRGDEPSRVAFDVFAEEAPPTPVFLDRAPAVDDALLARESLREASRPRTEAGGVTGVAAFEAWIRTLESEIPGKEIAERAFADHFMRVALHDARRAAAVFLRAARAFLPAAVSALLLRAAESYGYVADEVAKGGVAPFDASVVTRFMDPGLRRGWAHALQRALAHEREALAALGEASAR